MSRVLLIRHGETPWNRERRWQGQADIPLDPDGRRQAVLLAESLRSAGLPIHTVVSSDLSRAVETAVELSRRLNAPLVLDPSWREIAVGEWTGLCPDEIKSRFRDQWDRIAAGEDLPRGGGETFSTFSSRIVGALRSLGELHPEDTVAVVTHGGVIRCALLYVLGLPWSRFREISAVANTAVTELHSSGSSWTIMRRNQTAHLGPVAAEPPV